MKNEEGCRLEMVPVRLVKRAPGLEAAASRKKVGQIKEFARKRGHCKPVVLSDGGGCMTLIAGAAAFEACLEEKETKVPAVVVRTEGGGDDLIFALQSSGLDETLGAVAASAAIVQLIDLHRVPRRHIAEALGKSPAWVSRMENLNRKLNSEVQRMVAEGQVQPRSAQEIARLPAAVQTAFAVSVYNESLSKENVIYLVNRYLDADAGTEERDRVIHAPGSALPNGPRRRSRPWKDDSDRARLSRAIARAIDDASCLSGLLQAMDAGVAAVRMTDAMALADSLAELQARLKAVFFPRGKSGGGNGGQCR